MEARGRRVRGLRRLREEDRPGDPGLRRRPRRPTAGLTLTRIASRAFGRVVGVETDDLEAARRLLPHWWQDCDDEPEHCVTLGPIGGAETVSQLELWVAEHARELVFVHAGVVAVDGRALLLPGRSHAGKSTLTAALVSAGCAYGSDEYAPLLPDGRVLAYPRQLWLREPGGRRRVPVADLGGEVFDGALPVGGVATLRYGESWDVRDATAGEAMLDLVDNCVPAQSRAAAMLEALGAAVEATTLRIRGTRDDAVAAAIQLVELMSRA